MERLIAFVRRHLSSWDEVCFDDRARLRLNVILFTFTISVVYFIMGVRTLLLMGLPAALTTLILGAVTLGLFIWQFLRRDYSRLIAWLFGLLSLIMAALFISSGGLDDTGHLWIYILPIVGTMMVPLGETLIYNGALLVLLFVLLNTPLYQRIPAEYDTYFRAIFPISILILTLCNYVAEYTRQRTQKQLTITTERLRDSAFTDPLTGAYNRRALVAHFGDSKEPAHGLSFAMLDLDHFKVINDTHGHEAGDRLLCHLVDLIRGCIPAGAQLYRWGGEEFLLILKSGDRALLHQVLQNIRTVVAHTPLELAAQGGQAPLVLRATISIGGMCAAPGQDIEACIQIADERMYQAKNAGRDCVVVA